jgi:entericidin B
MSYATACITQAYEPCGLDLQTSQAGTCLKGPRCNILLKQIFQEDAMIKRIALTALVALCVTVLAGCNTVKGVGKDIESGGKAIERSSGK